MHSSDSLRPHRVSVVFPYYDNPEMLRFQLHHFQQYSTETLEACEIVIVDDCSPKFPARDVLREFDLPNVRLFRVGVDRPWNQDAARNIGAYEASGLYLLLTDIDHVVPEATLLELCDIADNRTVYTLARKAQFSERVIPSHVNSYFLSKELYWSIGGYDEDFWGAYGSDRLFRTRVLKSAPTKELLTAHLVLVTGGSISDAKNTTLSRRPSIWRRLRSFVLRLLKKLGLRQSPVALSNPYLPEP
ncbi:glycosyltransferase [Pontimonas sp.]|nr:glycosyltransferase [Pontimonas sp.]